MEGGITADTASVNNVMGAMNSKLVDYEEQCELEMQEQEQEQEHTEIWVEEDSNNNCVELTPRKRERSEKEGSGGEKSLPVECKKRKSTSDDTSSSTPSSQQQQHISGDAANSPELQYFQNMINNCNHLKEWRLQTEPCDRDHRPCIACWNGDGNKRNRYEDCRFMNRMLYSLYDEHYRRRLTLADMQQFSSGDIQQAGILDENMILETRENGDPTPSDAQIAAYIIQCAKSSFSKIVKRECDAFKDFSRKEEQIYFSHSFRAQQICDICNFSIVASHWCCIVCGTEVCHHCYMELKQDAARMIWSKAKCLHGVRHDVTMFRLTTFFVSLE